MLAYFIVFFMLIIVPKFFNKKRTNTICFLILFIFSAIRFDIGWDFRWYYALANKFDYIKYDLFISINEIMEIESQQFWIYYRLECLNKIVLKSMVKRTKRWAQTRRKYNSMQIILAGVSTVLVA